METFILPYMGEEIKSNAEKKGMMFCSNLIWMEICTLSFRIFKIRKLKRNGTGLYKNIECKVNDYIIIDITEK